ncbi:urease accessory protein UreD [Lyngbya aestuarii]|uniref:urease accessory protein UreD n=1 Tax=Lyngbya aestuarii TaxID=118322 RepID=UPI00403E1DE0
MAQLSDSPAPAPSAATGWHGSLELGYAYHDGITQLIHSHGQSPLKVQRPFYPEGPAVCHSVILHTAGGVVGGDILSQNIHLQPHAQALITTAAAAKIYRSNGLQARQNIHMRVDANACLEWLPQEIIVFNGAFYQQQLRVELAPGATWLGWEISRFGRSARGEKFLEGQWRSHIAIWQQGRPLWIDRQWLPAKKEIIEGPHGLAGKPIVATLTWVGQPVSPEIVEQARKLWMAQERRGEAGVTKLVCGLLCRYRGASTSEVRSWFMDVWQLLRLSCSRQSPQKPRVWLS